ncbi:glycosyltransferase [Sphingomonas sp. TREG-RG-20F-R18-01]|uniref:glycosyltransferase family 2 protein n=1 Tax=Sphingomonas sp. TREG-RG-20F-R18-01 TaxID=2914982 RepID=UPI001F59091A
MVSEDLVRSPWRTRLESLETMISGNRLSLAIVIASVGRPGVLAQWKERIADQTSPPDLLYMVVSAPADLPDGGQFPAGCEVIFSAKGSSVQRNAGLEQALGNADIIAFFDDDYVPSRTMVRDITVLFQDNPDLIAVSGHLLADGINRSGIPYDVALATVSEYDRAQRPPVWLREHPGGLYGCNMVYRSSAIGDVRFDEQLPLYGWLEDVDFGYRLVGRGRIAYTNAFVGVHQGIKSGRTSGLRLGYSQVANPLYLWRKGTMRLTAAVRLMARNICMNVARAAFPEPWVDRSGRLKGNMLALRDMVFGGLHPSKITTL